MALLPDRNRNRNNQPNNQPRQGIFDFMPESFIDPVKTNIQGLLEGKGADLFSQRSQEALARNVAGQRALTAQQLSQSNLGQQGFGRQIQEQQEGQFRQNLFDITNQSEQFRQQLKQTGTQQALGLAQQQFNIDQFNRQFTEQQRQFDVRENQQQFQNDMSLFNQAINAGDYQTASNLFQKMGGEGLNIDKLNQQYSWLLEQRKLDQLQESIIFGQNLLSSGLLDPNSAKALGGLLSKSIFQRYKTLLDDDFTDQDWEEIQGIIDGNTPNENNNRKIDIANKAINQVSSSPEWISFSLNPQYEYLFDGTPQNTTELGRIAAALFNQRSGRVTPEQRQTLEKYGLFDPQSLPQETTNDTTLDGIRSSIQQGNTERARREWEKLPDNIKEQNPFYELFEDVDVVIRNGRLAYDRDTLLDLYNHGKSRAIVEWALPEKLGEIKNLRSILKQDVKNWIQQNAGKITTYNGKPVVITGKITPARRKGYERIELIDLNTGRTFLIR